MTPAAQAGLLILAYRRGGDEVPHPLGLAAALLELADQVTPLLGRSPEDSREDERLCVRDEILAIAAELEGAK